MQLRRDKLSAMSTILAVMYITAAFGYAATAFLAIRAYFMLRRQRECIERMDARLSNVHQAQTAMILKESFDQIAQMKADMASLVEREEFEAAKQLQQLIETQEKSVHASLDYYKKCFGDNAEVFQVKIQLRGNKGQ